MTLKHNLKTLMKNVLDWTNDSTLSYVIEMRKELQQLTVLEAIKDYKFAKERSPNFVAGYEAGVKWLKDRILGENP